MLTTIQPSLTLKEARDRLGLSKRDLANKSGISLGAIMAIEGLGLYKTHSETARLLANSLGLKPEEIKWPRGLSDLGRPPETGGPTRTTPWQTMSCEQCNTTQSLSWKPGDDCENCS